MDEDQSPDCLGCCDELSRQKVVFPKDKDQDGDSRAESPVGLYTDRAQWCPTCWKYREPFDRFHLLYGQRLRNYSRGVLNHLPSGLRQTAADDVTAEALEALWKQREKLKVPERAMYRMAKRMAWRRFPLEPKETPAEPSEAEEAAEDLIDELVDLLILEEELAKLPEKTRQYLYEHKALGKTAEEVAASYGVRKSTVTESARRGLAALRPAFDYLRYLAAIAELVRSIVHWLS
ncbi:MULTISPECIES: RNA polymerase sigma factor [Streptomyces]|uniref:RNA polymerase sigma factor n=1 Tax=Streptomyces TaxID=1883 RepID=UPI000D59C6C8|nr:sigma-70 family RNA polymerase sigma factor [Streptomyces rishiriensis]